MQKPNYLIVEQSEIDYATDFQQPVRAHQSLEIYPHLTEPRVFVEVTDRVKFKRDSMGNGKFVSSKLGLVHPKHSKGNEDSGPKARNIGTARKAPKTRN